MSVTERRAARLALVAALFGLLYSLYLLTYSGIFYADDGRWLFDTTESIAERGSLVLNQTTHLRPLRKSDVEPMQPLLAVPLYLLAKQLDFVGNVQTVFLFNPLVTAATALVLFYYALQLDYSQRDALLAALVFGMGTIAWPYTKNFFREPLATLFLLTSFMFMHRWRSTFGVADDRRAFDWLALGGLAYVASALTKETMLVAAPLLAVYALPKLDRLRANRRSLLILGGNLLLVVALIGAGVLLLKVGFGALGSRYNIVSALRSLVGGMGQAGPGIAGFLVSPGKSVFVFSPVGLLALGGLLLRERDSLRERWLAIGILLVFAVFYAAVRPTVWYGGTNWGPRFLVPITPFLVLGAMPLLRRSLDARSRWPKVGLAALGLASLMVQVAGTLINFHDYFRVLQAQGVQRGAVWTIAIWQVRYSQVVGHWRIIGREGLDVFWARPELDGLALGASIVGVLIFGALLLWVATRAVAQREAWFVAGGSAVLATLLSGMVLVRAYDEPYFQGGNADLHELVDYLTENVSSEEAILLGNTAYVNFFANYYKADSIWYSMPHSPGERHSEEEVAAVISDDPDELIHPRSIALVRALDGSHPFWLVEDSSPALPWNPRPPEWWAATHYYTVKREEFSPTVRAIQYLSFAAPAIDAPPANELGARSGEAIVLVGYDLSGLDRSDAVAFHPGDELGLSLVWYAEDVPAEDYIAAVYLNGPDGQLVLQDDRTPVATFRPTTTWQRGETLRDNFGFILPDDLPPGTYQIRTTMYRWPSLERLPTVSAEGDNLGDDLLVTVFEVVASNLAVD